MDTAPSYWSKRRKIMKSVNKTMTAINEESVSCKTTPMNLHFEMSVFNGNFTDIAQVEKTNHVDSQSSRNQNV